MTDEQRTERDERLTQEEKLEKVRVAKLSDDDVLKASGHGSFGPGIIGRVLFDRAQKILKNRGGGGMGPAITDEEYGEKEGKALEQRRAQIRADREAARAKLAERKAATEGEPAQYDPTDLTDPNNPWTYVSLSGAKQLAQTAGVSYTARVKRADLIAELQGKQVVPPPVPTPEDLEGDDEAED